MMRKFVTYISLFIVLSTCKLQAQTSNIGKLHVSPGTKFSSVEELINETTLESSQFENKGMVFLYGDFINTQTGIFYNDGELFIYSNFINEGLFDFMELDGVTRFHELPKEKIFDPYRKIQQIRGSRYTFFNNIQFRNGYDRSPFVLSNSIIVEGNVDFKRGIIDADSENGLFIFESSAGYTNVSRASHVDGPVAKRGNTEFRFPVGDKTYYRYASLSDPKDPSERYEAKYFKENSDKIYPHALKQEANPEEDSGDDIPEDGNRAGVITYINEGEYWRVKEIQGESELDLTLSWDEETTPDILWENPEAIRIVRWDEEKQLWVDEGGVVDKGERNVTAKISDYGIFTLGTVDMSEMLPCNIAVYNAISPNGDGKNDYFEVLPEEEHCTGAITVKIYNRWGAKVFETEDYGGTGDRFDGYSQAGTTVGNGMLPTGTYFYVIEYYAEDPNYTGLFTKAGYLYLNSN